MCDHVRDEYDYHEGYRDGQLQLAPKVNRLLMSIDIALKELYSRGIASNGDDWLSHLEDETYDLKKIVGQLLLNKV